MTPRTMATPLLLALALLPSGVLCAGDAAQGDWGESKWYVACFCQGRLGNKLDYMLGTMAFAKDMGRSLVLADVADGDTPLPFDKVFDLEALQQYVPGSLPTKSFMARYGALWKSQGVKVSYGPYPPPPCTKSDKPPLNACVGSNDPSRVQFWNDMGVSITSAAEIPWDHAYGKPSGEAVSMPVLAMPCAPATYPVQRDHEKLQAHLKFAPGFLAPLTLHVAQSPSFNAGDEFVAVHLRIGSDFGNVCTSVPTSLGYFSSRQCEGFTKGTDMMDKQLTADMCRPSPRVVKQTLDRLSKALGDKRLPLFVASDTSWRSMPQAYKAALSTFGQPIMLPGKLRTPINDLAMLGMATHFIGQCPSSFSHFATRQRELDPALKANPLRTTFWGVDYLSPEDAKAEL